MDILTAKTTLDYPLYACDFDPADASRLIVGGGGGASRTGVGNKITLLNASSPRDPELPTEAEVELASDEDSVTCLAAGPRRGQTTIAYAGVNGNLEALQKGNNQHFRVLGVDGTGAASSDATKIAELARTALFHAPTPDPDMYQRVVRLSSPFPDGQGSTLPQIGACATGMAKDVPQIAVFDVACATPTAAASAKTRSSTAVTLPKARGYIELASEAADLDVIQSGPDQYQLAYCTDHQLFLLNISTASAGEGASTDGPSTDPYLAYDLPLDRGSGATIKPVFRAIRYVTPRFLLAVCNLPKRTGAILIVLRLPDIPSRADMAAAAEAEAEAVAAAAAAPAPRNRDPSAAATAAKFPPTARITETVRLPKTVSQGTGLTVRNLAPPAAPGVRQGDGTQFVVAVAGACSGPAGNTLSLYTLEYQSSMGGSVELLAKLYPFRVLRDVHELPMTSIALSPVPAPSSSSSSTQPSSSVSSASTSYLRLASVSVQSSVVVHYIPLRKQPLPPAAAVTVAGEADKPSPRYVVALKSRGPSGTVLYFSVALMVVVLTLLGQSLLEIRALTKPVLGVRAIAPAGWQAPLPMQWWSLSGEAYNAVDTEDEAVVDVVADTIADAVTETIADTTTVTVTESHATADAVADAGADASHDIIDNVDNVNNDIETAVDASAFEAFLAAAVPKEGDDNEEAKKPLLVVQKPQQTDGSADTEGETTSGGVADATITVVAHDQAVHGPAVGWDDLDSTQQQAWLQHLQEAGHWTEQMGEAVLRGVLFGELAGVVGAMMQ